MSDYNLGRGRVQVADYETNEILLETTCISAAVNIPEVLIEDSMAHDQLAHVVQQELYNRAQFLDMLNALSAAYERPSTICSSCGAEGTHLLYLGRNSRGVCISCAMQQQIAFQQSVQMSAKALELFGIEDKKKRLTKEQERRLNCTTRFIRDDVKKKAKRKKKKTLPRWR